MTTECDKVYNVNLTGSNLSTMEFLSNWVMRNIDNPPPSVIAACGHLHSLQQVIKQEKDRAWIKSQISKLDKLIDEMETKSGDSFEKVIFTLLGYQGVLDFIETSGASDDGNVVTVDVLAKWLKDQIRGCQGIIEMAELKRDDTMLSEHWFSKLAYQTVLDFIKQNNE